MGARRTRSTSRRSAANALGRPPGSRGDPSCEDANTGPVSRTTSRRIAAITALLIPILALGAFLLVRASDDSEAKSRAAVDTFAAVWSRGDDAGAGALTDSPNAAAALKTNRNGLDGAKVSVTPGALTVKDGRATGRMRVEWQVPAIGAYAYTAPVTAIKGKDGRWVVHYDPRTIHPRLTATTRLGTSTEAPARAGILDRDGS